MNGHPDPTSDISIDAYIHIVTCDHCTEAFGDERIALYGSTLLTIVTIANG